METRQQQLRRRSTWAVAIAASLAASAVGSGWASGSDFTFTRGGGDNNWDTALNWAGGVAPPQVVPVGDTTNLLFDGDYGTNTATAMRQDYAISSLTFGPTLASVSNTYSVSTQSTLLGGATSADLTLGSGGIVVNSPLGLGVSIARNSALPVGTPANLVLGANQNWAVNTAGVSLSVSRNVTGSGTLTKTGPGTAVVTGVISSTGGIVVSGGTLSMTQSVTNTMTGGITVGGGATLVVTTQTTGLAANVLTMQGGSTLAPSSTGSATLPNNVVVNGDFTVGLNPASTGRVVFNGTMNLGGGTRTVTLNTGGAAAVPRSMDLGGAVSNGTLRLLGTTGSESVRLLGIGYGLPLVIENASVTFNSNGAFVNTATVQLNANGRLDVGDPFGTTIRSPAIAGLSGVGSVISSTSNAGTGTLTIVGPGTSVFNGSILNSTNGPSRIALTVSGGELTLGGTNTYTGPTNITGGRVNLTSGAAIAAGSNVTVGPSGTLDVSIGYPSGFPVAVGQTLLYNGSVVGIIANSGLVRSNTGTNGVLSATVQGGSFQKSNSSTLTISGTVNSPTAFQVSGGTLIATATAQISSNNYNISSPTTVDLSAMPNGITVPVGGTILMNGPVAGKIVNNGAMTIGAFTTNNGDMTYPANISGTGSLTKSAATPGNIAGISTLTGELTFTGDVNVQGGVLIAKNPLKPVTGNLSVTGTGVTLTLDTAGYASASAYSRAGEFASITVGSNGQTGAASKALIVPVTRSSNRAAVVVTGGLNILADSGTGLSGFVDLGNGDMVVRGGAAGEATIRSYVAAWLGSGEVGLGASSATPNGAPYTTLGVFPNAGGFFSIYDGVAGLTAGDLIVKYTYVGDTNLDGVLDGNDLANVLEGFSTGATGWAAGDVDYSGGAVTSADVGKFLTAYGWFNNAANNAPSLGNGQGGGGASGAIPEPSALGVLAAPAVLLRRRRGK